MKKIKNLWNNVHEDDKFMVVLVSLMVAFFLMFTCDMKAQPKPSLRWEKVGDNHWKVTKDTTTVVKGKVTVVGVVDWFDGKRYILYRGSKGGMFILLKKKDGTEYRRYLKKNEKEKLGL